MVPGIRCVNINQVYTEFDSSNMHDTMGYKLYLFDDKKKAEVVEFQEGGSMC